MGVNIEQWQIKIEFFVQCSLIITHHHSDVVKCSLKLALALSILLLVGGIELNPSPPKCDNRLNSSSARDDHDNSDKLDQILTKLSALTADNMRLETKLDSFAFSINSRFDNMKTEFDDKFAKMYANTASTAIALHNTVKAVTDDVSHLKTELYAVKS